MTSPGRPRANGAENRHRRLVRSGEEIGADAGGSVTVFVGPAPPANRPQRVVTTIKNGDDIGDITEVAVQAAQAVLGPRRLPAPAR